MKPHPDLLAGLSILEPFLKSYGFSSTGLKTRYEPEGTHTEATFTNGDKKFVIGYRYSITFVAYQCDDVMISHSYYLDGLGFGEQKLSPGFQSEDKLLGFKNVLHDFAFIINDFFEGNCENLKIIAPVQYNSIAEINNRMAEEFRKQPDLRRIQEARQLFKQKKYFQCLEKYLEVEREDLLAKFDASLIHYCRNQKV